MKRTYGLLVLALSIGWNALADPSPTSNRVPFSGPIFPPSTLSPQEQTNWWNAYQRTGIPPTGSVATAQNTSTTPPSPGNNFNGLTGDALETAVKAYYAQQADKQAADALKRAQLASEDPGQLAAQVTQLQTENAKLKAENQQLRQDNNKLKDADLEHRQEASRLQLWKDQNSGAPQKGQEKKTDAVTQASDVLADFDKDEDDAKHKYASEPVQIEGRIVSFIYDRFGNGEVTLVLAQSENHKVSVKYSPEKLKNLRIPLSAHLQPVEAKLVHYNPDLNAIVGDRVAGVNGTGQPIMIHNAIIMKEGDLLTNSASFSELRGGNAVFIAN